MNHFDLRRSRSGRPHEVFLRTRRLIKLTSRLSQAPRGAGLTPQHHHAERFVRSTCEAKGKVRPAQREVKSADRSFQGGPRAASQCPLLITDAGEGPHVATKLPARQRGRPSARGLAQFGEIRRRVSGYARTHSSGAVRLDPPCHPKVLTDRTHESITLSRSVVAPGSGAGGTPTRPDCPPPRTAKDGPARRLRQPVDRCALVRRGPDRRAAAAPETSGR